MHLTNPRRPLKKLLCAMAAVVGIGSSLLASAADPLKVGFVYI
ncbi:bmp family protein, partial [Pseudomonas syringae pv. actinidiae ICMP 18804]